MSRLDVNFPKTELSTPLNTRTIDETSQGGWPRTVLFVDNPLQLKENKIWLMRVANETQKDRMAWIDAHMKKMLPGVMYRKAYKALENAKTPEQAAKGIIEVGSYMEEQGIEIHHPGGRSLHTFIRHKGKPVAEYEVRMVTR